MLKYAINGRVGLEIKENKVKDELQWMSRETQRMANKYREFAHSRDCKRRLLRAYQYCPCNGGDARTGEGRVRQVYRSILARYIEGCK